MMQPIRAEVEARPTPVLRAGVGKISEVQTNMRVNAALAALLQKKRKAGFKAGSRTENGLMRPTTPHLKRECKSIVRENACMCERIK